MDLKIGVSALAAAIVFFFAIIFAIASVYDPSRLAVAGVMFIVGLSIIVFLYFFSSRRSQLVQRVELSGEMKAVAIQCLNCGASIAPERIKVVNGVPFAACNYCKSTFEITEEPKW
ncbi:MAG: hypothetical protein JSV64_03915 [Candidatus Bathyarchaeota archaeon]|jgi:uncharacterized membrane protein|nr:MAG: hypothetical protein JSV64_03915 [Candidatus Bathyarchaeota archaeon]